MTMSNLRTKRLYDIIDDLLEQRAAPPQEDSFYGRLLQSSKSSKRRRLTYKNVNNDKSVINLTHVSNVPPPQETISGSKHKSDALSLQGASPEKSRMGHLARVKSTIEELRCVYLSGLQQVSKLQDLRDAPDAILPGNLTHLEEFR